MKKVIFLILSLIASICTIQPMQRLVAKLGQQSTQSIAKKGFSHFMTGLHWTIAAGLPISYAGFGAYFLDQERKYLQRYDTTDIIFYGTNKLTENCIKSKLQSIKNNSIKAVNVLPIPMMPIAHIGKTVIMDDKLHEELNQAIKENDLAKQNKLLSGFEHEASHIHNNDLEKRYTAALTFPFATHITFKKVSNFIPQSIRIKSFIGQQAMKIPSGLAKLLATLTGISVLGHYQEQRSDDEVSNNIDVLNGLKEFLQEGENAEIQAMNDPDLSIIKKAAGFIVTRFFHPSFSVRIKKVDQRIAQLKKSQQQQQNETIKNRIQR